MTDTNTQHALAVAELAPVVSQTTAYASTIEGLEIHDEETAGLAGDLKKDLQHYRRKIEDKRTSLVKPLNTVVKDINELFKAPRDELDKQIAAIGKKLNAYVQRQELLERQKREAEAKAAREREETLRKAAEAAKSQAGEDAAPMVEVIEKKADDEAKAAEKAVTARAAPSRGMKSTVSTVKRWVGEVTDPRAVCAAIAAGRLPLDLVSFSQSELNEMARAVEKETTRDGITYKLEIKAGVR